MKQYKVTVNGTAYEITLEAIDAADVKAAPAPAAAPPPSARLLQCSSHRL